MSDLAKIRFDSTIMVCRLCLNRDPFALDIFSHHAESKEIQDKIRLCIPGIKIFEDDTLPKHVCFRCLYKLELSSDFIKQCILAESVLTKNSHAYEGEPLAKARKTNVFNSLNSSEQDLNGIIQADSDNSFDDLDIHCISNGFEESHLNGNRMTAQAFMHKKQDKSNLFGTSKQYETRISVLNQSNQGAISNLKDEGTHNKRGTPTTTCFDNPAPQFTQEFLHNSCFKSDKSKNIHTNKWKGNRKTEEYLTLGDNKHNFLKDTTQKSSPLQKQKIVSPISFMHQLPSGSINEADTQIDNDSDEEIHHHIKILNNLRNKCPL